MDRDEAFKILYGTARRARGKSRESMLIALNEMLELDGCRYPDDQIRARYPDEAEAAERWFRKE